MSQQMTFNRAELSLIRHSLFMVDAGRNKKLKDRLLDAFSAAINAECQMPQKTKEKLRAIGKDYYERKMNAKT